MGKTIRIPTHKEWNKLVYVTGGDDKKMHWNNTRSYVTPDNLKGSKAETMYEVRGGHRACGMTLSGPEDRGPTTGFRPAIVSMGVDTRPSEGDTFIMGTLYMNGEPVRVPQNPTWHGDIGRYIPGAKLEMREPIADPAYQVTGIHIGDGVFIADRNLLSWISYVDIETALSIKTHPDKAVPSDRKHKYGYVTLYSFDNSRLVSGPFNTAQAAYRAMLKDAKTEERIDTEENGWDVRMEKDAKNGEIKLTCRFHDHDDVTTWLLVELPDLS